jgi:hypothetical protein
MVTSQMLCLEDGNRAREIACDMTSGYHTSLVYRYLDTFPRPADIPEWPDVLPEPELEGLEAQIRAGHVCIGTPEEVVKAVRSFADAGADQLVFGMLSTTMPVEIAHRGYRDLRHPHRPELRPRPRAQHPATARVVAGHRASIRRAPGTATVPYLTGPDPFAGPGPGDRCPAQGPTRVSKPRDGSGYKLRASKDCRQGRGRTVHVPQSM